MLEQLPKDILRSLKDYVGGFGYFQLYLVNKKVYEANIGEIRTFSLSKEKSRSYLLEPDTRQVIARKLFSPYHQLDLILPEELFWLKREDDEIISLLQQGLRQLTIEGADLMGDNHIGLFFTLPIAKLSIKTVCFPSESIVEFHDKIIHLTLNDVLELDSLGGNQNEYSSKLQYLTLIGCYDLKYVNIKSFPCLHTAHLNGCGQFHAVNVFACLQRLEIVSCLSVSDVCCLGHVRNLTIISCPKVVDISKLNHNQKIRIENCSGIKDYSRSFQQSRVIQLFIPYTAKDKMIDYHHWKEKRELRFNFNFPRYSDMSAAETTSIFSSLSRLSLYNCPEIRDLECFIHIPYLSLEYLPKLTSLLHVRLSASIRSITLTSCKGIVDYSPLRHLMKVAVLGAHNLVNLDEVSHVKDLHFRGSFEMVNLSFLNHFVRKLTIIDCPWNSLNEFSDIKELIIINPLVGRLKIDRLINCKRIEIEVQRGYQARNLCVNYIALLNYYQPYSNASGNRFILLRRNQI